MASSKAKRDPFTCARSKLCVAEAGKTGDWRSSRPEIDPTRCIVSKSGKSACSQCWMFCPEGIVKKSIPVQIDLDYCKGCGICAEECPAKAIHMVDEHASE